MDSYLKTKDYTVTGETFELLYDPELEMLITSPQPEDLKKYYESESYISHTDANENFVDRIYQRVKKISLQKKIKLVDRYSNRKKSLLDVGAGTGDFLAMAQQKGWTVSGVEPNVKAKNKAQQKGIALQQNLDELQGRQFQVISLWHVLEHLPNLEEQISKLKDLLLEDGVLVIAVPNFKSFDAKHYQNFWAAYDVPRHLWHFSKTAIEQLFAKHGMELVNTKPMVFDAFYVSLLSEKYKTGKQNLLKAFYIGLRSNCKAWRSKEYSSQIYVLKKA